MPMKKVVKKTLSTLLSLTAGLVLVCSAFNNYNDNNTRDGTVTNYDQEKTGFRVKDDNYAQLIETYTTGVTKKRGKLNTSEEAQRYLFNLEAIPDNIQYPSNITEALLIARDGANRGTDYEVYFDTNKFGVNTIDEVYSYMDLTYILFSDDINLYPLAYSMYGEYYENQMYDNVPEDSAGIWTDENGKKWYIGPDGDTIIGECSVPDPRIYTDDCVHTVTWDREGAANEYAQAYNAAKSVAPSLRRDNDYETMKAIEEDVASNCTYDNDAFNAHVNGTKEYYNGNYDYAYQPYGALCRKRAVCEGYAQGIAMIAYELGIPCCMIQKIAGHAGNVFVYGGEYYYLDATNMVYPEVLDFNHSVDSKSEIDGYLSAISSMIGTSYTPSYDPPTPRPTPEPSYEEQESSEPEEEYSEPIETTIPDETVTPEVETEEPITEEVTPTPIPEPDVTSQVTEEVTNNEPRPSPKTSSSTNSTKKNTDQSITQKEQPQSNTNGTTRSSPSSYTGTSDDYTGNPNRPVNDVVSFSDGTTADIAYHPGCISVHYSALNQDKRFRQNTLVIAPSPDAPKYQCVYQMTTSQYLYKTGLSGVNYFKVKYSYRDDNGDWQDNQESDWIKVDFGY